MHLVGGATLADKGCPVIIIIDLSEYTIGRLWLQRTLSSVVEIECGELNLKIE